MKNEILEDFKKSFQNSKGALSEVIEHNRAIDANLVKDLITGDFKKLEEHIEVSKLILEGIKSSNELFKQTADIIKNISKLEEEKDKKKSSLSDLLSSLGNDEDDDNERKEKE